jgi:hypothetical protein
MEQCFARPVETGGFCLVATSRQEKYRYMKRGGRLLAQTKKSRQRLAAKVQQGEG